MTIGQAIATGLVAVLSFKYGHGVFRRKDLGALLIAGIGIVLWRLTDAPLYALTIVILVDLLGMWLTMTKTWKEPETETLSTWLISGTAGLLGVCAVAKVTPIEIAYPLYICGANIVIATIILARRKRTLPA